MPYCFFYFHMARELCFPVGIEMFCNPRTLQKSFDGFNGAAFYSVSRRRTLRPFDLEAKFLAKGACYWQKMEWWRWIDAGGSLCDLQVQDVTSCFSYRLDLS